MLNPDDIRSLCQRKYPAFLRSIVVGGQFFPLKIPFGRPSPTEAWSKLSAEITALVQADLGYTIDWAEVNTLRWGRQQLPQRVWFKEEAPFLRMLRRESEVAVFRQQLSRTREALPGLADWMAANAVRMIENAQAWPGILKVCEYFIANPRPNRYARELPIAVDTKFIERHYAILRSLLDHLLPETARTESNEFEKRFGLKCEEPLIRLRLLDPTLKQRLGLCVDDISAPVSQLAALPWSGLTVIIIENAKTFLTLPHLENTIGVFARGAAAELLSTLTWCTHCRLFYWGDIDIHGLHILARLRRTFPQVESVMMDDGTLTYFRSECGRAKTGTYEDRTLLTSAERRAYELAQADNLLLEQEKIPYDFACQQLRALALRSSG